MTAIPQRLTVLLADNDESEALLIRRALNQGAVEARLIAVENAERAILYLQGQGKYSDRASWPLPHVLLLKQSLPELSGLDTLCWLRREPRLGSLPVVILGHSLSTDETQRTTRLKAAWCAQASEERPLIDALFQAMTRALNLVRDVWLGSKAAYASARPSGPTCPGPIRVWT